jgi:hypothetical protein
MSCKHCKTIIDPSIPFAEFDYAVTQRTVNGHSILAPLVKIPARPQRGWSVILPVKGQPQTIHGDTGRDVAYNATRLYKLNGLQADPLSLWFNLNLQWLQRTAQRSQMASVAELLALAEPVVVTNEDKHALRKTPPSQWANAWWTSTAAYLGGEYDWDTFLWILNNFHAQLNPTSLMGCSSCYVKFTLALDKIKNNPAYKRDDARVWFIETKKSIGALIGGDSVDTYSFW